MYRYSVRDTTEWVIRVSEVNNDPEIIAADAQEVLDWIAEGNTIQSFADGQAFDALRRQRNYYLRQTDWWASSDRTMTSEQIAYRQALRDLPANTEDPLNPTWPIRPS